MPRSTVRGIRSVGTGGHNYGRVFSQKICERYIGIERVNINVSMLTINYILSFLAQKITISIGVA